MPSITLHGLPGIANRHRRPLAQQPPARQRPARQPLARQPLARQRPARQRPAQQRPAQQQPPARQPPARQRPAQQPPAQQRPAQQPPAQQPPAQQLPAQQPPAQQRPAQQPPGSAASGSAASGSAKTAVIRGTSLCSSFSTCATNSDVSSAIVLLSFIETSQIPGISQARGHVASVSGPKNLSHDSLISVLLPSSVASVGLPVPANASCPKIQTNWCLRYLLLVMCTHPFVKQALTLHLARSEGHERYFGCNLMHRKVLASSYQYLMTEAPVFVSNPDFRVPRLRQRGERVGPALLG